MSLETPQKRSAVRLTADLLPIVLDDDLEAAASASIRIHEAISRSPIRVVRTLDRALRDRTLLAAMRIGILSIEVSAIDRLGHGVFRPTLYGIASVQRDGYLRASAMEVLAGASGHLPLAFLLNRLNDPVPQVRDGAEHLVMSRLVDEPVETLVRVLPLLAGLEGLRRASGATPIHHLVADRLCQPDELMSGFECSEDHEVRLAVLRWNARLCKGTSAIAPTLAAALRDAHPQVRNEAAALACARSYSPRETLATLLPTMDANRSPRVRQLALQAHQRLPDADQHTATAAFDLNAGTRALARRYLHRRGSQFPYRDRALRTLQTLDCPRALVVGALALLSEYGRTEDIELVRRFVGDDRRTVSREAARTLRQLELER